MGRINIPAMAGWYKFGTGSWNDGVNIIDRNFGTWIDNDWNYNEPFFFVDLGKFYKIKYLQVGYASSDSGLYPRCYVSDIPDSDPIVAWNNKTYVSAGDVPPSGDRVLRKFYFDISDRVIRWIMYNANAISNQFVRFFEISAFVDTETAKFQILNSAGQPLNLSAADRALGNVYLNYPEGDTLPGGFPDRKFRETAGQITLAYQTGKIKRYIKNIASNPMTNVIATKMTNSGDSSADEIMSLSDSENGTYGSSVTYPGPVAANGTVELWVKTDATNMGIAQIGKHYNNIQILGTEQIP